MPGISYKNILKILSLIPVLFLSVTTSTAQIISDWNDDSGIISTWDEEQDVIHGWSKTLEEFTQMEDQISIVEKSLKEIPETDDTTGFVPVIGRKTIVINGRQTEVPTMIVDGMDMYMLLEEGISIYMAANPPAFYEDIDHDTVRWIRYYAFSKREYTAKIFRRYEKWSHYVGLAMEAESVPSELGLLCLIESGCTYKAVSSKGAAGMWQFMPETATEMGLEVSMLRDERTDPVKSTKAAARYLKKAYRRLGSWTMAAASYNCGIGRTAGIVRNHGKNWIETKASFPKETRQYVPALQAIHYVWTYREEFGL